MRLIEVKDESVGDSRDYGVVMIICDGHQNRPCSNTGEAHPYPAFLSASIWVSREASPSRSETHFLQSNITRPLLRLTMRFGMIFDWLSLHVIDETNISGIQKKRIKVTELRGVQCVYALTNRNFESCGFHAATTVLTSHYILVRLELENWRIFCFSPLFL